jgi:outer membrane protein TolC
MKRQRSWSGGRLGWRRPTWGLLGGAAIWLSQGCAQFAGIPATVFESAPVIQAAAQAPPPAEAGQPTGAPAAQLPAESPEAPPANESPAVVPNGTAQPAAEAASHALPISLDAVLHLAEDQNPQIALARERVHEAFAEKDVAAARWLPDLYVGTAYYRHEGGIQNEDGTLTHSSTGALFAGLEVQGKYDLRDIAYQQINAQRKVWQQKGELSRVTSETLLDAANTYIDLLTVRTGEAIARDLEKDLQDLLDRARKLASSEPAARVEVARIQAELDAQQQTWARLHSQANGAAAKLIYLLGLDPHADLVPVDRRLIPFQLVDASPPVDELVAQALANGPGVREMEGLLNLIQESMERAKGPGKYLPVFELRMAEGAFGAGPGEDMAWDNRWDLGLQARWNVTELFTVRDRQRVGQAKMHQAHLAYQDLRGKLTAGVQEARDSIQSGQEQIRLGETQIQDARQAYDLTTLRLKEVPQATSYSESLLAIGSLGRAQGNYLQAISAYDKAELRLLILLGSATCNQGPGKH